MDNCTHHSRILRYRHLLIDAHKTVDVCFPCVSWTNMTSNVHFGWIIDDDDDHDVANHSPIRQNEP